MTWISPTLLEWQAPGEPMVIVLLTLLKLTCGTDASIGERLEVIDARRRPAVRTQATVAPTVRDNVVVLPSDPGNLLFDHSFNIPRTTLRFKRRDASSWLASSAPLAIDPDHGNVVDVRAGAEGYAEITLPFDFPFYGRSVREIFLTPYNAIFLNEPEINRSLQISDLDLAMMADGVVAPMLTTDALQGIEYPEVSVVSGTDLVRVTWKGHGFWQYVVQATITPAGDITFAYDVEVAPYSCALVIKDGPHDGDAAVMGRITDPAGDATTPMLDIVSAEMARIDDTNLIRFRIETAAGISTASLAATEYFAVSVNVTQPALTLRLYGDGRRYYSLPGWGIVTFGPAARVMGKVIELAVLDEHLALPTGAQSVRVSVSRGDAVMDEAEMTAVVDEPSKPLAIEAANLGQDVTLTGPILEAFTLPVLNASAVWRQVRDAFQLDDSSFDAVAIYQNFSTDIVLYASAYSSGGNPGADNIIDSKPAVGADKPRSPALMHMNTIENGLNLPYESQNLMHELGHRWLYDISILEDGARSRVLNPLGGHPAQYVHTAAAFPVRSTDDSSVMGGGTFTDRGDGSFTTWKSRSSFSYSWTDLYLMGLAAPSEVRPWFYLANASPALGPAYYPPADRTYQADRRDVTIDQVIGAMGPRRPAYPATQREFRVLFVLMARDGVPDGDIAQLDVLRRQFQEDFRAATNGRGTVRTSFNPAAPARRRAAGK